MFGDRVVFLIINNFLVMQIMNDPVQSNLHHLSVQPDGASFIFVHILDHNRSGFDRILGPGGKFIIFCLKTSLFAPGSSQYDQIPIPFGQQCRHCVTNGFIYVDLFARFRYYFGESIKNLRAIQQEEGISDDQVEQVRRILQEL